MACVHLELYDIHAKTFQDFYIKEDYIIGLQRIEDAPYFILCMKDGRNEYIHGAYLDIVIDILNKA